MMKRWMAVLRQRVALYLAERNPQTDFFPFVFKIFSFSIFIFVILNLINMY